MNIPLFTEQMNELIKGETVELPRYDFQTGKSVKSGTIVTPTEQTIFILEGIHALNPELTKDIPAENKFKIYASALTTILLDNHNYIPTTDNRLLRRITRDYATRGSNALATLQRWPSVRRGEEKHIFPYQEEADVMFNSSLFYEICVLCQKVEPILREVPDTEPEYGEARRLLKFIDHFAPIAPDEIPPTSILREFIGGSSFKY
jgi:uridine kinase